LPDNTRHAFLSGPNGGPLSDLGALGGIFSNGSGVNASGQVTGTADLPDNTHHAFLSGPNGGPLSDLGTLGGTNSTGNAINATGQVAGFSNIAGAQTEAIPANHAFLSGPNGGPLNDLGTLGGTSSIAYGVNASGQVVGDSELPGDLVFHAFLYTATGGMQDLNNLIHPGSGFTLLEATGITDLGQITGYDMNNITGQEDAFLLTLEAVPEPSTWAAGLLTTGVLLYSILRRRKTLRADESSG
jgi:probable HAF family extracellular repeat protein